jgi:hypothetical protein
MAFGGEPFWRQPGNPRDSNKCRFRSARLSSAPRRITSPARLPPATMYSRIAGGPVRLRWRAASSSAQTKFSDSSPESFHGKVQVPPLFGADAERRLSHPWRHLTNPNHYLPGHHDPWPLLGMGVMTLLNLTAILPSRWDIAVLVDYERSLPAGRRPVFAASNIPLVCRLCLGISFGSISARNGNLINSGKTRVARSIFSFRSIRILICGGI